MTIVWEETPKARSFDFYQDWGIVGQPTWKKANVHIVLSEKQEANLKDFYHRMPKEAEQ